MDKKLSVVLILFGIVFFLIILGVVVWLVWTMYKKKEANKRLYNVPLEIFQTYGKSTTPGIQPGTCYNGSVDESILTTICTNSSGELIASQLNLSQCAASPGFTLGSDGTIACAAVGPKTGTYTMTPCSFSDLISGGSPTSQWFVNTFAGKNLTTYCGSANIVGTTMTIVCGPNGPTVTSSGGTVSLASGAKTYSLNLAECGLGVISYNVPSAINDQNGALVCTPGKNMC